MTAYEFVRFYMDIHKDKLKDARRPEDWLLLVGIDFESPAPSAQGLFPRYAEQGPVAPVFDCPATCPALR